MNKTRRTTLQNLLPRITKIETEVEDIRTEIESVRDEEQEAFDNMPPGLQESERGQASSAAIESLEGCDDDTDWLNIRTELESAIEHMTNAIEMMPTDLSGLLDGITEVTES